MADTKPDISDQLGGQQMKLPPFLVTYLRLGKLLHLITIIELMLLAVFFLYVNPGLWFSDGWFLLKVFLLGYVICLPVFAQLDVRSRYQNYKQVKDQLYLYGFRPRILIPYMKSRCQRDAVITASEELGLGQAVREFYKNYGYKWYHLFPDFAFSHPHYLLTPYFWKNTFFKEKYIAKIDFRNVQTATCF